jgi:hypothetical protein
MGVVESSLPEIAILGGMAWTSATPTGAAMAPVVRLSLFDWGLRLVGVGPLRVVTHTIDLRLEQIESVDVVRSFPLGDYGVRFRASAIDLLAVFWTGSYSFILDWLGAHGVAVSRAETRFGFIHSLDQ